MGVSKGRDPVGGLKDNVPQKLKLLLTINSSDFCIYSVKNKTIEAKAKQYAWPNIFIGVNCPICPGGIDVYDKWL